MENHWTVPSKEDIRRALELRHGVETQRKLSGARVAVAGLGGLGSHAAVELARAGVGHLHLVDFDCVDLTNLNRQHYFIRHLGRPKTEALREQILEINPYLDIRVDQVKVTPDNAAKLFETDAIVCEAFDVPENKAMLVNEILERLPDIKLVCASGMAGYGDSNKIVTRRVMRNLWICGDSKTEAVEGRGLMAPRVAVCASHEANMILQLILDEENHILEKERK